MDETAQKQHTPPQMVTIEVGKQVDVKLYEHASEQRRAYRVSINQLCEVSHSFKKVLCGPFREAEEKKLTFDDVSSAVFETFLLWMSSGLLKPARRPLAEGYSRKRKRSNEAAHDEIILLVELCRFADYICCNDLHNAAAKRMFHIGYKVNAKGEEADAECSIIGLHKLVPGVYKRTSSGHPLRKMLALLLAQAAIQSHNTSKVLSKDVLDAEFYDDFWAAMRVLGLPCHWPCDIGKITTMRGESDAFWEMRLPKRDSLAGS